MNFMSRTLTPDDPGIFVEILDIDKLHEAMGLVSSPFAAIGDTPAESVEIFRNWILEQTNGVVNPGKRVDIEGSLAWHHLLDDDVERLKSREKRKERRPRFPSLHRSNLS